MKETLRTPHYWEEAKRYLSKHDPVLGEVIAEYHGETLASRGDAFGTLSRSIAGQQISVKAADSVWKKLEAALGEVIPARMLALSDEEFRACGFSKQKIAYLRNIATYFSEHQQRIEAWDEEDEEVIIHDLTSIKGVGRWTAEMFLIFFLMKPDVFPVDDIGVLKAIALRYFDGLPYRDFTKQDYQTVAAKWQPYRTVATWYLWRSLDPLPVEY